MRRGQAGAQGREKSYRQEGGVFKTVGPEHPRVKILPFCKGRKGKLPMLKKKKKIVLK